MSNTVPEDSILRRHHEQLQQAGTHTGSPPSSAQPSPQSAPRAAAPEPPPAPRASASPPPAQAEEKKGFLGRLFGKLFGG